MQLNNIGQKIVDECLDQEGFLALLHSQGKFDEKKYRNLMNDISSYASLLGNNEQLNRSVASCLFELMAAISTSLAEFFETDHPELAKVQKAHIELSTLLHDKIFIL